MPNKLPVRLFNIKTMTTVIHHDFPKSVFENGYVAVSHVWGEQDIYTPEDIGIKGGVDWEIPLSDTNKMDMLENAMKKFKMEWCWFDVLCMPQGEHNQGEVNKEIPYMGDYYNGAKMTLVLSDGEGMEVDSDHNILQRGMISSFTKVAQYSCVSLYLAISWKLEKEPWFFRLWTFQEAVMSNTIWIVRNKEYLDLSDTVKRLASSEEKHTAAISDALDTPVIRLAHAAKDYHEYKTSIGRMLYECRNRECFKPQDRYYGMLGVLGYTNFPVTYDITMEELGKKFIEHAYYNGDVSWLAVHVYDKIGFIPSDDGKIAYIGELWREEKPGMCNIKFGKSTLWINACIVADVTHSKDLGDDCKIIILNTYKDWDFAETDVAHALAGYCELSDEEIKQVRNLHTALDDESTFSRNITRARILTGTGGKFMKKVVRHINLGPQKVCKIVCRETGKNILVTIFGQCNVGDKIMVLPIYDKRMRTLGIVVDDTFRRKGICLYPKSDVSYEYTPHEFPL